MRKINHTKKYLFFIFLFLIIFLTHFQINKIYAEGEICNINNDHPDESYAVNSGFVDTTLPYIYKIISDAVILNEWNYKNLSALLRTFKKSSSFTDINTSPTQIASRSNILCIPSGGLAGLDNSQMFKDLLAQFVSSGGVIICLAQQHGYEFSALPDGEKISAYGWLEDQGCFSNSLYLNSWHQILSGLSSTNISAAVDGYFTNYPDNTLVLLRRIKNGEAGMIMYPYGDIHSSTHIPIY